MTHPHGPLTDLEILVNLFRSEIGKRIKQTGLNSAVKWDRDKLLEKLEAKLRRMGRMGKDEVLNERGKRHFAALIGVASRAGILKVGKGDQGNRPIRLA